jgi:outer membrane lipoprotein-sorting protein
LSTLDQEVIVRFIGATIAILSALNVPTYYIDSPARYSSELNATQIMKQVVETYHSLSTYSDKGVSIDNVTGTNGAYEIRVDFETLFKRPRKLRFAWTLQYSYAPGKRQNVIWSDGETVWSSYFFRRNEPSRAENLGSAVAGAIAVSQTTAHTITRLLSDEIPGIRLDELADLKVLGDDTADGVECFVLVGSYSSGESRVWVGRQDHLIRRIEDRSKFGTRKEVRTQISVNQDIADSRFSEQLR